MYPSTVFQFLQNIFMGNYISTDQFSEEFDAFIKCPQGRKMLIPYQEEQVQTIPETPVTSPPQPTIAEFRTNPDVVECELTVQIKYFNMDFTYEACPKCKKKMRQNPKVSYSKSYCTSPFFCHHCQSQQPNSVTSLQLYLTLGDRTGQMEVVMFWSVLRKLLSLNGMYYSAVESFFADSQKAIQGISLSQQYRMQLRKDVRYKIAQVVGIISEK